MRKPYNNKFLDHRLHAKKRGIEWQFTYEEWINWWGDDIANRGPRKGQLVMARFNDSGPYHPNNVQKLTVEENVRDAQLGKPKSKEHTIKCVLGRAMTHQNKQLMKEVA